jgi:hypothetical protein
MNKMRGYALMILLLFMGLSGVALNLAAAPTGYKTVYPTPYPKSMRADTSQGWIRLTNVLVAQTIYRDATLFHFDGMSAKLPHLGFSVSAGRNMTSLGVSSYTVSVQITGAGSIRVYNPDYEEPEKVKGASYTYSAPSHITTLTFTGAGPASVSWSASSIPVSNIKNDVLSYVWMMALIPLVLAASAVYMVFNGGYDLKVVGIVIGATMATTLGVLIVLYFAQAV